MAIITQPYFWDEQAAHAKLERLVWPDGPICPHCSARERIGAVTGKGARTALKFCCHCRKQFRATMGTMFEGSHVPLHKWFQACFLLTTTHRGISPHQLHLRLEVTNKTALAMVHRIEEARRGVARGGSAEGGLEGARRRVRWRAGPAAPHQAQGFGPSGSAREERAFETGAGEQEVPWARTPSGPPRQFLAFAEIARDLGYAEDGETFDKVLAQIARYRPPELTRRRYAKGGSEQSSPAVAAPGEPPTRRFA
ncbi:MAG: transposase [Stellaceae bacterium]